MRRTQKCEVDETNLPIPTQVASQKRIEHRLIEIASESGEKLKVSRRVFLACSGGMAAFLPMNGVFAGFFDASEVVLFETPGPRIGHSLAYDERRKRIVLFGGINSDGVPTGDTWEWDGKRWLKVAVTGPSARKWSAMTWDSDQSQIVLFGGREGVGREGASLGDTWVWDGEVWKQLNISGPSGRDHHTFIYDRSRKKTILFGGWDGNAVVGDTWELDRVDWKKIAAIGPESRAAHSMTYDIRQRKVILFGGRALDKFFDDTWIWDGKRWTRQASSGPSKRAFQGMVYHETTGNILLFGGRMNAELFNDTWIWVESQWRELKINGPSKRLVYSMVYDSNRRQIVFFGGGNQNQETQKWHLNQDTWIWDEKWTEAN